MADLSPGQTLQATALVHEAYLKLVGNPRPPWQGRKHFYFTAAEAMRQILIDRARKKNRFRRGGDMKRVTFKESEIAAPAPSEEETLLSLNTAIDQLTLADPEKAQIVKLRFFIGLTEQEIADQLALSDRTVKRHWSYAKAWLFQRIRSEARR